MRIRPLSSFSGDLARARRGGAFGVAERDAAARVVKDVRRRGDAAVLGAVRRFDRPRASARDLVLDRVDIRRAAAGCPREVRAAIEVAYVRILGFHERQRPREVRRADGNGELRLVPMPLDRVGALVPRGTVSYPSTALMTGAPAQIAGVRELIAASPMPADGSLDPALAFALVLVGAEGLYRAGGAAAVAGLAYGTNLVKRVDKIVGPGNSYTAAAKWLVSADVGIDALQGPSELVIIASAGADPRALALDLEAQAEHGSGAFAALIAGDGALLREVVATVRRGARRMHAYRARDLVAAAEATDEAAPEHVLLAGRAASSLASRVRHAGAVFVGARSAVAFGDYVAGTNHALPTGGTARWASALRVEDFVRWTSRVELRADLSRLARAGMAIAEREGMRAHAASMGARI